MSIVYLAQDMKLDKKWAVKQIKTKQELLNEGKTETQIKVLEYCLEREKLFLSKIENNAIPRIVDEVCYQNRKFIVMDYIDGKNIGCMKLNKNEIIKYMIDLLEIIEYLHSINIVYRDIKPSNILISNQRVKLIDFGSAKWENEKNIMSIGTNGYASFEQIGDSKGNENKIVDRKSDIYSIGATMYKLFTGDVYNKNTKIKRLPRDLKKIILKCLKENKEERYNSCQEVIYELNKIKNKNKIRNLRICSIFVILCSIMVLNFRNYKNNINHKYFEYINNGEYEEALNLDETQSKAYEKILEDEEKINFLENYIERNYKNLDDEILLKVANIYFYKQDYKKSAFYYSHCDKKTREKCIEYYEMALILEDTDNYLMSYKLEILKKFDEFNKNLVLKEKKRNSKILIYEYEKILKTNKFQDEYKLEIFMRIIENSYNLKQSKKLQKILNYTYCEIIDYYQQKLNEAINVKNKDLAIQYEKEIEKWQGKKLK